MAVPYLCLECTDGEVLAARCACRSWVFCWHRGEPVPCPGCRCDFCGEGGADCMTDEDGLLYHAACLEEDPTVSEPIRDEPVVTEPWPRSVA